MYTSWLEHAVVTVIKIVSQDDLYPFQRQVFLHSQADASLQGLLESSVMQIASRRGTNLMPSEVRAANFTGNTLRHKVFISYGLMHSSRLGPSTNLCKMNDSRKLPQQHGTSGSCNCHCVNSARRSMKRVVEEPLSVVASMAVLHSTGSVSPSPRGLHLGGTWENMSVFCT